MNMGNWGQYPVGVKVLVVDDNPTCLRILERMLRSCDYQVTTSNRAEKALSLLRENRKGYDIIISDVHMPDMDGFKLLEHVGLEMDLPVIMISADDRKSMVMKGVTHGACDYLIKPVRIEALKTIGKHVVLRKMNEWKEFEQSGSLGEWVRKHKPNEGVGYSSSANKGNWTNSFIWSVEAHQQFVAAVDKLGVDRAWPKKILEMMNVPGLTRENVASHFKKYRLYLRSLNGVSQHHVGLGNSFMGPRDAAFESMPSINGLDLQAGHLPAQSLANLQAATLTRSPSKSSISMPGLDQRNNIFSFENPSKLRFGDSNSNSSNNVNSNNQANLLHGISTSMKPKQLAKSRGMNMQQNPRGKDSFPYMLQMNNSNNLTRMSSSAPVVQKSVFSTNGGSAPNKLISDVRASGFEHNELISNVRASGYNPLSQTSPMVGFSSSISNMGKGLLQNGGISKESQGFVSGYNICTDLAQNNRKSIWDLQNGGLSNMGTGFLQNEGTSKESQAFISGSDIFNDLAQHKTKNIWDLQNVGLSNMGTGLLQNEGTSKELQGSESGYNIFNDLAQHKTTNIWDLQNVGLSNMGTGLLQNEGTSKESQRSESGYDIFNDLAQHKTTNIWDLQNVGLSFESTPHANMQGNANNLNVQPSVLVHQGFSSGQNGARNRNGNGIGNLNMGQQFNTFMGENSLTVESELIPEVSSQNPLLSDQFGQEDILSIILKQQEQQEGIGPVPNDFVFDGFPPLDDLPF